MSLRVATRIARRELRGGLRSLWVFLACLTLGVAAIAAVGTVRESIRQGLSREGATILGGDAEIQLTYRRASAEERAWMEGAAREISEIVDFRSLAVAQAGATARRGLTQVKAVDGAYPLYGEVRLEPPLALDEALAGRDGLPGAVMERLLAERLGIAPGGRFRLGRQEFVLTALLLREPDNGGGGFSLGPRTIVRSADLRGSGLIVPGTLFQTAYRLRLPPGTDLDALAARARKAISGGGFRWRDSRDGAPGVREFVDNLGRFLVLVGLAGLAVGGVGISAAVRAYLEGKVTVIATLKSLGAEGRTIFQVYLIQLGILGLLGIVLGLGLGAMAPLLLAPVIEARLPIPVVSGLHAGPLAEAALYGALVSALFTLWPLARTERVRAAALFRDASLGLSGWPAPRYLLFGLALLAALVGAAAWFSPAPGLAAWAAGGIAAAFVALLGAALLLRLLAGGLARRPALRRFPTLRQALGAVGGPGGETVSVVLSLGLGLSVLAAVGQIDYNLRSAIAQDLPEVAPAFFVVDIQKDQLPAFRERLNRIEGVSRIEAAPMLRGMITRINGRPAREVVGDHWVVTGDRGITYSQAPPDGSTVVAGEWWPEGYDGPPQISFSVHEAEEMGLKLGDTLTVNILGRDITGTITSFRNVDFSTAGMGFVLSMNPAAISAAPHTYIATVYADPDAEAALLETMAEAWPNITAISVREAIDRVSGVLRGIAAAVTYGALATLLTGVVVLIGAAAASEQQRTYEAAILKTLGATRIAVLVNFSLRSGLMGASAGLVAVGVGGAAGWAVMTRVMDMAFRFEPVSALVIVWGGVVVSVLAGLFFSLRSLAARPARILRARE